MARDAVAAAVPTPEFGPLIRALQGQGLVNIKTVEVTLFPRHQNHTTKA